MSREVTVKRTPDSMLFRWEASTWEDGRSVVACTFTRRGALYRLRRKVAALQKARANRQIDFVNVDW